MIRGPGRPTGVRFLYLFPVAPALPVHYIIIIGAAYSRNSISTGVASCPVYNILADGLYERKIFAVRFADNCGEKKPPVHIEMVVKSAISTDLRP